MDYEQKYKETLNRARSFYERWQGIDADASNIVIDEVKKIFPEFEKIVQYQRDERIGDRMVLPNLYAELCKKGYKGQPSTQQIIDWLREEHWLFINLNVYSLFEKRLDGSEYDRAYGFRVEASVVELRPSCVNYVGDFDRYEQAEIESIKFAVKNLI